MFLQQSQAAARRILSRATVTHGPAAYRRAVAATASWQWDTIHYGSRSTNSTTIRAFSTMELIKDLRAQSGAPIVDCKKALANTNNDINAALDWLREHGAAKVSSKVGDREAKEGLVGLTISDDHQSASLVQVSSETDFAGRSDAFVNLVMFCADAALQKCKEANGTVEASDLLTATHNDKTVQKALDEAKVAIRENLSLGYVTSLSANDNGGVLVGYVHGRVLPSNAGTAACIVDLSPAEGKTVDKELLLETGKKLAMHIVAAKPQYLYPESVPEQVLEGEKNILKKQLEDSKKPPEIIEKIVSGKIRKFYETVCLTEQAHMIEEDNPKISKNLKSLGIELNRYEMVSIA